MDGEKKPPRNPYSTEQARNSWQRGYDGVPVGIMDWVDEHARGARERKQFELEVEAGKFLNVKRLGGVCK